MTESHSGSKPLVQDPADAGSHQQPPPGGSANGGPRSPRRRSRQEPADRPPQSCGHWRGGERGDVAAGQGRPHHEV